MTTFFLVRHGHNDWIDKGIPGWTPEVHLNEQGRLEALRLAERFPPGSIAALFSSPLERTKETAAPLAKRLGLKVSINDDLGEVRCGEWTGLLFADLSPDKIGELFGSFRKGMCIPGGESITDVQERMVRCLDEIRGQYPDQRVVVVSHGDPIKSIAAYYAGAPLASYLQVEIRPCSVTILEIDAEYARIVAMNDCDSFEL